ncbi:MAG TPA: hypothetical protein VF678_04870 [bacterium]
MLRRPGIGTPGADDKPREVRLCFLYRADQLPGAEAWVEEVIGGMAGQAAGERESDGGIRDERVAAFEVSGKPGGGAPPVTWFIVAPGAATFSVKTTEAFADKLLLAVRKWGTRTYYLDCATRQLEDWSQRRGENTKALLDRAPGQVIFHPVLLRGEFIPEEEVVAKREAWRHQAQSAHEVHLVAMRASNPGQWMVVHPATYADRKGLHLLPGIRVIGTFPTERAAEDGAVDYGELCFVVNITTGDHVSRWANR